jgi:lipopolysaccharide export LptBFGC system permease protein LptF
VELVVAVVILQAAAMFATVIVVFSLLVWAHDRLEKVIADALEKDRQAAEGRYPR